LVLSYGHCFVDREHPGVDLAMTVRAKNDAFQDLFIDSFPRNAALIAADRDLFRLWVNVMKVKADSGSFVTKGAAHKCFDQPGALNRFPSPAVVRFGVNEALLRDVRPPIRRCLFGARLAPQEKPVGTTAIAMELASRKKRKALSTLL